MSIYTDKFDSRIEALEKCIFGGKSCEQLQEEIAGGLCKINGGRRYAAFISICNKADRAEVIRFSGDTLRKAWEGVLSEARRFVNTRSYDSVWVKADIMNRSEKVSLSETIRTICSSFNEFFRRGLSFDEEYASAMIEAEINGNRVISYKKQTIELSQVNKYISSHCGKTLMKLPDEVIQFDCLGWFCDEENNVYSLYNDGMDCGRRITEEFTKELAMEVIGTSSEYLSFQVGFDGKFDYGYYPIYYKLIPKYNILRHASSIWSLICAYSLTGDSFTLRQAEAAIAYMIRSMTHKYNKPADEENTGYLVDRTSGEIRLGGNAVAIIVLTEYMKCIGTDRYMKICTELGNGILEMQNSETGEFYHVLDFPTCKRKEKYRTVYYDGEAAFALTRLYSLTHDEKWLNAAKAAVEHFIRADYTKHRDHWVAYAVNEITMHLPEERYFEFGLKNVQKNLDRIYNQPTTYHTYLELLTVTFEMYMRIKKNGYKVDYLDKFDEKYFVETIFHRAQHMLNGYCYPEYAMYLKYPGQIQGAFFVRHDGFRIRIDDVQHFCGAYYSFYRDYDELKAIKDKYDEK